MSDERDNNGRVKIAVLAEQDKLLLLHIEALTRQVNDICVMLRDFTKPEGVCDRRFSRVQHNEKTIGVLRGEIKAVKRAVGVIIGMLMTILAVLIRDSLVTGGG